MHCTRSISAKTRQSATSIVVLHPPENWKYAIGEVLLIVTGITVTLAVDAWYGERQERNEEANLLLGLRDALVMD